MSLCLIRATFSLSLLCIYGWPKLSHGFAYLTAGTPWSFIAMVASLGFPFPVLFAILSTLVETAGAAMLAAGLFTRVNSALLAFNMAVAVWLHVRVGEETEPASLYLFWALAMSIGGGGRYSLDAWLPDRATVFRAGRPIRPGLVSLEEGR